ncbi:hypothetical protein BO82DRAFT_363663 [Aspergillus uvarum CBS 121591]|uniref:Oxidoreductase acuF-like C2H2 type zinc-finger domain-containing protein n=1 Tax=Aspergillus uvarum CBS 121591 TaxID=1448315 RepID=A0A319DW60_9EURO|nr:hypothetical protein BO82DRAFT_363663 [Aspergillus uvarum CBS 121591]PYH83162.1 hypothetical protein BO82DRAFT_363663 [Aspergillus uvarum CBS 121591]
MSTLLISAWLCHYLHQLTQHSGLTDYSTTAQDLYRTFRELVYDRRGYLHLEELARNAFEDSSAYTLHIEHLRLAALQLLDLGEKLAALDAPGASAATQHLTTPSHPLPTADILNTIQTSQNAETRRWHLRDQIRRTFDTARWWLHDLGAVITDELEDDKVHLPLWQQIADKRFDAEAYGQLEGQLEAWFASRRQHSPPGDDFKLTPLHRRLIRLNLKRRHYLLALQQHSSDVYTLDQFHAFKERGVNFPAPPNADAVIHGSWTEPPPSTTITTSPQDPETETFQCPYCLTPLPTSLLEDRSSWRSHLTSDLRHLTCLASGCESHEAEGFVTVQGWVEHLETGRNIGQEYDSFFGGEPSTPMRTGGGGAAAAAAAAAAAQTRKVGSGEVPHTGVPDECPICKWRPADGADDDAAEAGAMLAHLELELRFFALLAIPWAAEKPYELFAEGAWEEWVEGQGGSEEEVQGWVKLGLLEDVEDGQDGEALGRLLERAMGVD